MSINILVHERVQKSPEAILSQMRYGRQLKLYVELEFTLDFTLSGPTIFFTASLFTVSASLHRRIAAEIYTVVPCPDSIRHDSSLLSHHTILVQDYLNSKFIPIRTPNKGSNPLWGRRYPDYCNNNIKLPHILPIKLVTP